MAKRSANGKKNLRKKSSAPGRLRIVAGIWRSRVLEVADVPGLRPTPERVRETLFNWLSPQIIGKRCLDLFAGTGVLGLEALSRGAGEAVFVEKSSIALEVLRRNVARLGAEPAQIVAGDAFAFIEENHGRQFDVVFLDPPFADGRLGELCRLMDVAGMLAPDAKVYLEQGRQSVAAAIPGSWHILKEKNAGNVHYSLVAPVAA